MRANRNSSMASSATYSLEQLQTTTLPELKPVHLRTKLRDAMTWAMRKMTRDDGSMGSFVMDDPRFCGSNHSTCAECLICSQCSVELQGICVLLPSQLTGNEYCVTDSTIILGHRADAGPGARTMIHLGWGTSRRIGLCCTSRPWRPTFLCNILGLLTN